MDKRIYFIFSKIKIFKANEKYKKYKKVERK
nr:MAG TPA: hypothetical protein [Caudoviricetes sp.]